MTHRTHSNSSTTRPPLGLRGGVAVLVCALFLAAFSAQGQSAPGGGRISVDPISFRGPDPAKRFKDIEIEQKLGAMVPLDLKFANEKAEEVRLSQYFEAGKPVVLAMVYYDCPSICNEVLNGLANAMDAADIGLELGQDYTAIAVSINPNETPTLAAAKKANYLKNYHRPYGNQGWHFLTGQDEEIRTLANSVGFRFYYEESTKQYAHAGGIMILTPEGKVSSYYFGLEYLPQKLNLALVDASGGKVGSLAAKLQLLCYMYDPATGAYGFYVMGAVQLFGMVTMALLGAFWLFHYLRTRWNGNGPLSPPLGGGTPAANGPAA